MKIFCFSLLVLLMTSLGTPVAAQCLSLADLMALARAGNSPAATNTLLPASQWRFDGPTSPARELNWTWAPPDTTGMHSATLTVRPNPPTPGINDIVLRTTQGACVRQLRSALARRKREPQLVTCVECEGQRYQEDGYTVSIYRYSPQRWPYPFVVVVHFTTPAPKSGDSFKPTADTLEIPFSQTNK